MKTKKLFLDFDEPEEDLQIGLLRLAKEVPDYELFYHINLLNNFQFSRIEDFVYHGNYYDYFFPRFQSFYSESKVCIQFIANKSSHYLQKEVSNELFSEEAENEILLKHFQEADYLIKTSEPFDDFSVILLPENLTFQIQNFQLSSQDELYALMQYYL